MANKDHAGDDRRTISRFGAAGVLFAARRERERRPLDVQAVDK